MGRFTHAPIFDASKRNLQQFCLRFPSTVLSFGTRLCLPVSSADNLAIQFGPRSGPTNRIVGPDQGPNCLTF